MADAARVIETMNVEGFLAFVDARHPGERWELHDGEPRLMVGGSARHGMVIANIVSALHGPSRARGCNVLTAVLARVSDLSAFEPDVVVACGASNTMDRHVDDPRIVFEVLSPSTMRYDRGLKFDAYRRMTGLQQIVFVYQDSIRVESYFRNGDSWADSPKVLVRREDSLAIPSLGTSLGLDAIYLDVEPTPLD